MLFVTFVPLCGNELPFLVTKGWRICKNTNYYLVGVYGIRPVWTRNEAQYYRLSQQGERNSPLQKRYINNFYIPDSALSHYVT